MGIGPSAGSLDAFKQFFSVMPADSGMAFVLVQHLEPTHESLMTDLLSRYTRMKVVQVEDRMPMEADHLQSVVAVLRARTKYDFRCYKKCTLRRRIERRMGLNQIALFHFALNEGGYLLGAVTLIS